jgi:hypothetical protein
MNKKDLKTLSESYEKIFENTIAGMLADESGDNVENEIHYPTEAPSNISIGIDGNSGEYDECDETKEMNLTKLKSLMAHTNKVIQFIQNGKEIDAWMTDKITSASNMILDVSNVIEFKE